MNYEDIIQTFETRWIRIRNTTPSGKSLFSCVLCGRLSAFPDKACVARCELEEEKVLEADKNTLRLGSTTIAVQEDGYFVIRCLNSPERYRKDIREALAVALTEEWPPAWTAERPEL